MGASPDLPPPSSLARDPRPVQDLGHGGTPTASSPAFLGVTLRRGSSDDALATRGIILRMDTSLPSDLRGLVSDRVQPLIEQQINAQESNRKVSAKLSALSSVDEPTAIQKRDSERLCAKWERLQPQVSDVCHRGAEAVVVSLGGDLDAPLTRARRDAGGAAFAETLAANARDGKPHQYLLRATYEEDRGSGHSWVVLQQGTSCVTFQSNAGQHSLADWATRSVKPGDRDGVVASRTFGGLQPLDTRAYGEAVSAALGRDDLRGLTGCPVNGKVLFGFEEHRLDRGPAAPDAVWASVSRDRFDAWAG